MALPSRAAGTGSRTGAFSGPVLRGPVTGRRGGFLRIVASTGHGTLGRGVANRTANGRPSGTGFVSAQAMLSFRPRPSRILASLLATMHGLCVGMVWMLPLAVAIRWFATAVLAVSLAYYLHAHWSRRRRLAVRAVELSPDCGCRFQGPEGQWVEATVLPSSFVAPYMTVLNLKPTDSRWVRHVVILPDSLEPEAFRRLRVLLRWKCSGSTRARSSRSGSGGGG